MNNDSFDYEEISGGLRNLIQDDELHQNTGSQQGMKEGENKEEKAVNNLRIKVHISEIDDYVKNRLLEIMMEAYDVRATNNYWACLRRAFVLIELLKHLEKNQVLDKHGCLYREDYVDYIKDYLEKVENQTGSKKIATVQAGELNLLLKELFTKTF